MTKERISLTLSEEVIQYLEELSEQLFLEKSISITVAYLVAFYRDSLTKEK